LALLGKLLVATIRPPLVKLAGPRDRAALKQAILAARLELEPESALAAE